MSVTLQHWRWHLAKCCSEPHVDGGGAAACWCAPVLPIRSAQLAAPPGQPSELTAQHHVSQAPPAQQPAQQGHVQCMQTLWTHFTLSGCICTMPGTVEFSSRQQQQPQWRAHPTWSLRHAASVAWSLLSVRCCSVSHCRSDSSCVCVISSLAWLPSRAMSSLARDSSCNVADMGGDVAQGSCHELHAMNDDRV